MDNAQLINGPCKAGAALSYVQKVLFAGDAGSRRRVVVILMAGKASDDVSTAAGSLQSSGVKIITIGVGFSVDKSQLKAISFPSSCFISVASFNGLETIAEGTSTIISQGMCYKI